MRLICPDAFLLAYRNPKATFECLKAFRQFHPESSVYLVSDGGDDLSDIAAFFNCKYECLERIGRPPWSADVMKEWLRRFVTAARLGNSDYIIHLEDDVLIRGPIYRQGAVTMAGPYSSHARLSARVIEYLHSCHPQIVSDRYGGCGGTLFHRTTLMECAEGFDFLDFPFLSELESRVRHNDVFLTLMFLLAGHPYESLEDVYCEATFLYPGWETNGKPIVHQYKRFYGQELTREDKDLLRGVSRAGGIIA